MILHTPVFLALLIRARLSLVSPNSCLIPTIPKMRTNILTSFINAYDFVWSMKPSFSVKMLVLSSNSSESQLERVKAMFVKLLKFCKACILFKVSIEWKRTCTVLSVSDIEGLSSLIILSLPADRSHSICPLVFLFYFAVVLNFCFLKPVVFVAIYLIEHTFLSHTIMEKNFGRRQYFIHFKWMST